MTDDAFRTPRNDTPDVPTCGVLVIDKPAGPTSHDIVAQARRYFRTRRIGHAGTLDPMASGVLLVLVGEATKLSNALTLERKSYEATVRFGSSTDTDDAEGHVVSTAELAPNWLDDDALLHALESERARVCQTPPIVTAIKTDGVAAHRRHRQGQVVEVSPRDVRVFALELLDCGTDSIRLALTVSKGYYVRALARDLGRTLGVPAHLAALRRTSSGEFSLGEAHPWPPPSLPKLLSLVETVRRILPCLSLTEEGVSRARVGKELDVTHVAGRLDGDPPWTVAMSGSPETIDLPKGTSAWLDSEGNLVALGSFDEDGHGRVARGFVAPST
ncbi:MAG: tRNA pseudouridine(55) synthase TruB [Polyangiaceae bacterium]